MTEVSIVTTTYNERPYIKPFVERVRKALRGTIHEIIIVDDSSPDGTYYEAKKLADKAILVKNAGQTRGLLTGIKNAEYPIVVTLDVDLENPPELIPQLVKIFINNNLDLLIASRTIIPRFSEKLASYTIGKIIGVKDVYSNFRVYRKDLFKDYQVKLGETFGGELLIYAWKKGYRISEVLYYPPPRRERPRVGGKVKANLRILLTTMKLLLFILT